MNTSATVRRVACAAAAFAALAGAGPGLADPGGAAANQLHSRAWVLSHLGPAGLHKCRAYKAVVRHTQEMQKTGGGRLTPVQQRRLGDELAAAKAMPPKTLTAFDCGVPL